MAAQRLIEYLKGWVKLNDNGTNDPIYQLAMMLIERNKQGDLDYKAISKLYELEARFDDPDYSEIMALFKESHTIDSTAINFYFHEKDDMGVWRKLEPSFNRM